MYHLQKWTKVLFGTLAYYKLYSVLYIPILQRSLQQAICLDTIYPSVFRYYQNTKYEVMGFIGLFFFLTVSAHVFICDSAEAGFSS